MVRESAVRPDMAHPIWASISKIFSIELGSSKDEVTLFSTPRINPSAVLIPTAVEPNYIMLKENMLSEEVSIVTKGKKKYNNRRLVRGLLVAGELPVQMLFPSSCKKPPLPLHFLC